nr:IS110 family transposase [Paenibacillus macerans]
MKTDRRDAEQLARLFRAGELTPVYVPEREDEALRELVRAREAAKEDTHRARQRILKFLLRHHIEPPATIKRRWTRKYRSWLEQLTFPYEPMQVAFDEMLHTLNEIEQRMGVWKSLGSASHGRLQGNSDSGASVPAWDWTTDGRHSSC